MQKRVNDKRANVIQKRDSQSDTGLQKKAEELQSPVRDRDPLGNIACRIGDKTCAAKHISVIQRTGLFHPMNESQRVQSLIRLQQQYGNRFVQRVTAHHAIQAKSRQLGNIYEQEADRVVDRITQMTATRMQRQEQPQQQPPDVVTRIVYAEAGGENQATRQAVAAVILNRIASPEFPNDADAVVSQARQFAAYGTDRWNASANPNNMAPAEQQALQSSGQAVAEARRSDITNGSMWFYDTSIDTPPWMQARINQGLIEEVNVPDTPNMRFYRYVGGVLQRPQQRPQEGAAQPKMLANTSVSPIQKQLDEEEEQAQTKPLAISVPAGQSTTQVHHSPVIDARPPSASMSGFDTSMNSAQLGAMVGQGIQYGYLQYRLRVLITSRPVARPVGQGTDYAVYLGDGYLFMDADHTMYITNEFPENSCFYNWASHHEVSHFFDNYAVLMQNQGPLVNDLSSLPGPDNPTIVQGQNAAQAEMQNIGGRAATMKECAFVQISHDMNRAGHARDSRDYPVAFNTCPAPRPPVPPVPALPGAPPGQPPQNCPRPIRTFP